MSNPDFDQKMEGMTKAYDVQYLIAEAKKEGIEDAELVLRKCTHLVAAFLRKSAALSTDGLLGKVDDYGVTFVNKGETMLIEKLDAIDGNVDEPQAA